MAVIICLPVTVYAAVSLTDYSGAIGGFKTSPKSIYSPDIFNDIDENLWYGVNVQSVI